MKLMINSVITQRIPVIAGVICGICVGSTYRIWQNEKLPNPFQVDSPAFIITCLLLIYVLPCFVPFFNAIRALQFKFEDYLFDLEKNEEIRQTRPDLFGIFLKLLFILSFYSSLGLIISALWTEWSVAILGGASLIGSFIALKFLGHYDETQKNTCISEDQ